MICFKIKRRLSALFVTFKTDIKTAVEAAESVLSCAAVPDPRLLTLVVLRLSQGPGEALAGGRGHQHLRALPWIFILTADTELSRELATGQQTGLKHPINILVGHYCYQVQVGLINLTDLTLSTNICRGP